MSVEIYFYLWFGIGSDAGPSAAAGGALIKWTSTTVPRSTWVPAVMVWLSAFYIAAHGETGGFESRVPHWSWRSGPAPVHSTTLGTVTFVGGLLHASMYRDDLASRPGWPHLGQDLGGDGIAPLLPRAHPVRSPWRAGCRVGLVMPSTEAPPYPWPPSPLPYTAWRLHIVQDISRAVCPPAAMLPPLMYQPPAVVLAGSHRHGVVIASRTMTWGSSAGAKPGSTMVWSFSSVSEGQSFRRSGSLPHRALTSASGWPRPQNGAAALAGLSLMTCRTSVGSVCWGMFPLASVMLSHHMGFIRCPR